MARKSQGSKARHALRSLSAVKPSDREALSAIDPATLERLVRRVGIIVRGTDREGETESLACLMLGRLWIDGGDVDKTAAAAVSLASRTVAEAYAGVDSLDRWAEAYGDMVETVVHAGSDRADIPRAWCPRPDSRYATTAGDVVRAALDSLRGTEHYAVLRDAARAYAEHGDRRCSECNDPTAAGRRVSLVGILAHTRGLSGTDSQYHAIRRAVLAALRAIPAAEIRAEHYYPHAEGGRSGSVSLDREPRTEDYGKREREARGLPATDLVTVRHADGTEETHTEDYYAALRSPRTPEDIRAEALAIAEATSRKVRQTARKRGTGTGAYGSQVGARLSR